MQEGREEVGGRAEGDDEKWQEGIEGQGIHGLFKELNLSIEHGIEVILMFLYKMKPILVLSFIVFLQIENEYTDIKRRVELETNEIRDKQQVRRSYTWWGRSTRYYSQWWCFFLIFMMVNDGFKGGRNDDHENVNRNSETPQKLFGT